MKKFLSIVVGALLAGACHQEHFDTVIRNARVVDGSGKPSFTADVGINADTIAAVGDLSKATAKQEIDATGLVLSPGFIDTHSHHDWGMFEARDVAALASQGVTTMIIGQDGGSRFPIAVLLRRLDSLPVAINVGSYTGHNTLRRMTMGDKYQREATPEEVGQMKKMLAQDMENGSLGLSTGLEYDPGIYSNEDEVVQLAAVVAPYGGRYISHMRSEDRYFWDALKEIIHIGREAGVPVQISHAKLAMKSLWGQSAKMVAMLDSAREAGVDITADVYPYPYWQSTMTVLFPQRNFKDRAAAHFALTELTTPQGVIIGDYSPMPGYVGKTLAEVAELRKTSAGQTLMDLIDIVEKEGGDESIIATSMDEADIQTILMWPYANICSDGTTEGLHPRGHGAFTKVLRQYVREQHVLTLEEAIHKMTGQAAANLNLKKIGEVVPGYYADLVLFDPNTVSDRATFREPHALSVGIKRVFVSGVEAFNEGGPTRQFKGRAIRRAQ
ncbi:MAG: D-aminoacylase [Cyclobacteriaceae bacterium]|nr:D-aminoacylase [Cyclobacteriaceae bacterium]MCB9237144.1 D-aminoacylase [Flammeovirgaceae bacterium]MCB0500127.1 D-aminoacylase [Cyclobacteriaceae bacterium]MCO5270853.1 D-aminoacylase [Cyclobacteriaceae bacterium]MCW5901861.1 D-aminoacylase [Cyclobacteriaceae bacterium]